MIDPMDALNKLPELPNPTSLISSLKPTTEPTKAPIVPGTTPEYQEASDVGTRTLW